MGDIVIVGLLLFIAGACFISSGVQALITIGMCLMLLGSLMVIIALVYFLLEFFG